MKTYCKKFERKMNRICTTLLNCEHTSKDVTVGYCHPGTEACGLGVQAAVHDSTLAGFAGLVGCRGEFKMAPDAWLCFTLCFGWNCHAMLFSIALCETLLLGNFWKGAL